MAPSGAVTAASWDTCSEGTLKEGDAPGRPFVSVYCLVTLSIFVKTDKPRSGLFGLF